MIHSISIAADRVVFLDGRGRTHRLKGPALQITNVETEWYRHGVYHRLDGPAIVIKNLDITEWCIFGKTHRLDGPAVQTGISNQWWLYGDYFRTIEGFVIAADKLQKESLRKKRKR